MPLFYIVFLFYYETLLLSCLLIGCLLVRKSWRREHKLLVILSGMTLLVETEVTLFIVHRIFNRWLYTFFAPVECGFIIYILYRASVHPAIKRLSAILLGVLPISIGIAYCLHPAFYRFNDIAGLFYLFSELLAACSFLVDVLLNKSDTPPGRQPLFWLACGMLFYCSIYTLINAVSDHIVKFSYQFYLLYSIVANTFMYTGFIACFICLHRARRGSSVTSPAEPHCPSVPG